VAKYKVLFFIVVYPFILQDDSVKIMPLNYLILTKFPLREAQSQGLVGLLGHVGGRKP